MNLVDDADSRRCENPDCGGLIPESARADATTCSDACRTAAWRARKNAGYTHARARRFWASLGASSGSRYVPRARGGRGPHPEPESEPEER